MDRARVANPTHFINWQDVDSHLFLNRKDPRFTNLKVNLAELPKEGRLIWLPSSGTSSSDQFCLYALSKTSFLISADAVNNFLMVSQRDVWLNVLPLHHVGGLSIFARAYLSGNKVYDHSREPWSPRAFHKWVKASKPTLTSLVPTQVYDLIQLGEKSPKSLRAIVVGGAKLSFDLYLRARKLGFPVLPSYGMTECASQIATASIASISQSQLGGINQEPPLVKLSHVEIKLGSDDMVRIKSKALFSKMAIWDSKSRQWQVLKRVGDWYSTKDRANLEVVKNGPTLLRPGGRIQQQIKVSGELVNLLAIEEKIRSEASKFNPILNLGDIAVIDQANARLGSEVALCLRSEHISVAPELVKAVNLKVSPPERIRVVYFVDQIEKTDLGKVKTVDLKKYLGISVG